MRNTIRRLFFSVIFLVESALASNEVSAYFIYEYGKIFGIEHKDKNLVLDAKIFLQNPILFDLNSFDIESDGGELVMFSAKFPFKINSIVFESSFLFAGGNWDNGSFNFFNGKPFLPYVLGLGISINGAYQSLNMDYILLNGKILNNNEEFELFNSISYLYNVFYKLNANKNVNLYAGFAGLNTDFAGELTAANQQYFLFPYSFYKAEGYLNVKTMYGLANFKLETSFAEYGVYLGAITAINESFKASKHYKYRKFYGTDEFYQEMQPISLKGSGIAFLNLDVKTKKIKIGNSFIQYGIQKPLAIPFGDFFSSKKEGSESYNIADILFFGLTANVNIIF